MHGHWDVGSSFICKQFDFPRENLSLYLCNPIGFCNPIAFRKGEIDAIMGIIFMLELLKLKSYNDALEFL